MTSITHQHSKCTAWRVDPGLIQSWSRVDPRSPIWYSRHSLRSYSRVTPRLIQTSPRSPNLKYMTQPWPVPSTATSWPFYDLLCPSMTIMTINDPNYAPLFLFLSLWHIMLTCPMPHFHIMTHYAHYAYSPYAPISNSPPYDSLW